MTLAFALLSSLCLLGPDDPKPVADTFKPDPAWRTLGKDIWFDPAAKRLILRGRVALREGSLEHLICSKGSKDHESTLTTEAPPKLIHAGLLLTGAEAGHPVRFEPKFEPPTGSAIAIDLEWVDTAGKTQHADARSWVKDLKTGKILDKDWVFAGSELFEDPRTKEKIYAADDGDIATVANFPSSLLDVPFRSSSSDADRSYISHTNAMPERGTPVTIYLKPRPKS